MNSAFEQVTSNFKSIFGHSPQIVVRSPGRINLIGEHTDYNDGFVLPAAIDRSIIFAITPVNGSKGTIHSTDYNENYSVELSKIEKSPVQWVNYILGVLDQVKKLGYKIDGFDCAFGGDIPIGAGLSSSAAVEAGFLFALNELFNLGLSSIQMANITQKAEHEFAGVKCGIMDMFTNLHGKKDQVIKLDCRSLEFNYFPFKPTDLQIVLCDTQIKHSLASSEYNKRRSQCESGVKLLQQFDPKIKSLRDVSIEFLENYKSSLEPVVYKRCLHVVRETRRVELACEALVKNNFTAFGEYMYQSHNDLRDNYEVSCAELDLLVDIAGNMSDVLGSRMMGGGFGGCTINLIKEKAYDTFSNTVIKKYSEKVGKAPSIFRFRIGDGTGVVS